jgi:putative MATE family efflux protein
VSFGYNALSAILRGLGDSRTPLYALIISTVVNIILDSVFVIVFKWGVAGVGIATVIAQAVAYVWTIRYLNKRNPEYRVHFRSLKFDREIFRETFRIGLPSGAQQTLIAAGLATLTAVVNQFGTNPAAAYSAVGKLDSFVVMPAMNIGMAVSTFTGQNLGAGKGERCDRGSSSPPSRWRWRSR